MFTHHHWQLAISIGLAGVLQLSAAGFTEDFSVDPAQTGWKVQGSAPLFQWNALEGNLEVTWNTSEPNSYFHRSLGTILTRDDDFTLSFDLRLKDIAAGVNPAKPFAFQLAIGLLNIRNASATNFLRGTGVDPVNGPKNLVEFDYFPNTGYGATISPTIISSNNEFAYGFAFQELPLNQVLHVQMSYQASAQTLVTVVLTNGSIYAEKNATLGPSFTDFRVDTVSISSFSDAGSDGSLLAHGVVDHLQVITPPLPMGALQWQVGRCEFANSNTNFLYTLEQSQDLVIWADASPAVTGNGENLSIIDTNALAPARFYRIKAERP